MTTLFLDFASHQKSIGLVDANHTIALEHIDDHADEAAVMSMIEKLLSETKKPDRIAAVTGPGGFMSLRVGLSIANALAWSLKIPAAGIHLSDMWHARVPLHSPPPPSGEGLGAGVLWVHSTKKEMLFVRGFGDLQKRWPEPVLLPLADLQNLCNASCVRSRDSQIAGEGASHTAVCEPLLRGDGSIPFIGELIESQALALPELKRIEAIQPLEDVLPELLKTLTYGKDPIMPWYGRGA